MTRSFGKGAGGSGALLFTMKIHKLKLAVISSLLALFSPGCVAVGGYSSGGGWFIWPGSITFVVVVVILFLVFRRRK